MTDTNTTRSFLRGVASEMVFCAEPPEPLEGAQRFLTQVVDVPLLAFDATHLGVLDSLSQVSDLSLIHI